ncbi:MAG: hypothetical protein Q9169_001543 [Polycauliona sp. 2 TL-2023]
MTFMLPPKTCAHSSSGEGSFELLGCMGTTLQDDWKSLYSKTLPSLASSKYSSQKAWPVHLDHCFARIILDNAIGIDRPWTSKIASPAMKNMTHEQLGRCVALGKAIADGTANLADLDAISLALRGKKQKPAADGKRKRGTQNSVETEDGLLPRKRQLSIQMAFSASRPTPRPLPALAPTSLTPPVAQPLYAPGDDLTTLITTSNLSSFRQLVFLALCQVPHSRFTTYAAISDYLRSSARAVGNALRNNPFAPYVPCHRVVVSHLSH